MIVDIRLQMLKPRELYRAQGFPDSYIIERNHNGQRFTLSQQVHMCGNSVRPEHDGRIRRSKRPGSGGYGRRRNRRWQHEH